MISARYCETVFMGIAPSQAGEPTCTKATRPRRAFCLVLRGPWPRAAVVVHGASRVCLTFELSRERRQPMTGRGRTMTTMAWSGQALAAVARRLERGVRFHYRGFSLGQ